MSSCALIGSRSPVCVAYPLFFGTSIWVDGKRLSDWYKPQTRAYMDRMLARPGWLATVEQGGLASGHMYKRPTHGPIQSARALYWARFSSMSLWVAEDH